MNLLDFYYSKLFIQLDTLYDRWSEMYCFTNKIIFYLLFLLLCFHHIEADNADSEQTHSEQTNSENKSLITVSYQENQPDLSPDLSFWEKMVERLKKTDDFYNKTLKPEVKRGRICWFQPSLVHFDGFKWAISNTINYRTKISDRRMIGSYVSYEPLQLKSPFSHLKMHSLDYGFMLQNKISKNWFSKFNFGMRRFIPNQSYRDFYETMGQEFYDKNISYFSFGLGFTLMENVLGLNRSLVWFIGYTVASDLKYPSPDPFGYTDIKIGGFFHGFSFSYKF